MIILSLLIMNLYAEIEFCKFHRRNGQVAYIPDDSVEAIVWMPKKKYYGVKSAFLKIKVADISNFFYAKRWECGNIKKTIWDKEK